MIGVLLAASMRALGRVDYGQRPASWRRANPQLGRQNVSIGWMTESLLDDSEGDKAIEPDHVNGPQGTHDRREAEVKLKSSKVEKLRS